MKSVDQIAAEIKYLIDTGELPAGKRIPAERQLAEILGVSRGYVRLALHQLEFCGIIQTLPQSGSYVAEHYFSSLVDIRLVLEREAVKLCALNRTEDDLAALRELHKEFISTSTAEERSNCDMRFHQRIAAGGGNPVLSSLLRNISSETLVYYHKYKVCNPMDVKVNDEHARLIAAIESKNPSLAESVLLSHLLEISNFAKNSKF